MFICNILIYYTYNSSFIVLFFASSESLTLAAYIVHDIVFIQKFFLHGLMKSQISAILLWTCTIIFSITGSVYTCTCVVPTGKPVTDIPIQKIKHMTYSLHIVFIQKFFLHGLIEHNDRRFVSVPDKVI
jgi:hypothetical protein